MNENIRIVKLFNKNKWVVYLMAFLIGSAIGIIIPLTSTHMSRNHVSDILIGVIASVYFFTIALGTILINKKLKNKDLKKLISLGLLVSALCTFVFPVVSSAAVWFILMAFMGFGVSFHLVGTQTVLHRFTDESIRGVVSGVYTLFFAFGFAFGTIGGPKIYEKDIWLSFIIGASFLLIAAFLLNLKIKTKLTISANSNKKVIKKILLSLQGAFSYGFIENTIAAMYPLFLLQHKFTLSQMGYALGMFVIGGIVGTIPITYIGDRIGREKGLIISALISISAFLGIIAFDELTYKLFFSFIAGIGIGAIYPISMALGVQGLDNEEIISAASNFTLFYSLGCAAGPVLSSIAMNRLGNNYLFSISLILLISLLYSLFSKINSNAPKRDKLLTNLLIHQELKEIIYYGTLAPSSHNAQMWKVKVISDNEIMVLIDTNNVLPELDPSNRESFLAIGGFIENIAQAAHKYKLTAKIDILSRKCSDINVARISFEKSINSENSDKKIYNIENRLNINDVYLNKKLNQKDVASLLAEIEEKNGYYFDVNSPNGQYIQQNLITAMKEQALDKKKQEELANYMRLSDQEANANKDGITAEMIGLTGLKKWFYYTFTTKKSITSDGFIKLTTNKVKSQVNNCSGFFIITSTDNSPEALINAGRNMERLWLKGIELKVALHPMSQIIEEKPWKEEINTNLNIDRPIQIVMRAGYVKKYRHPVSLRRSINDIIIFD